MMEKSYHTLINGVDDRDTPVMASQFFKLLMCIKHR